MTLGLGFRPGEFINLTIVKRRNNHTIDLLMWGENRRFWLAAEAAQHSKDRTYAQRLWSLPVLLVFSPVLTDVYRLETALFHAGELRS